MLDKRILVIDGVTWNISSIGICYSKDSYYNILNKVSKGETVPHETRLKLRNHFSKLLGLAV